MKDWFRSHKCWTTLALLGLLVALCGPLSLSNLKQRRDMTAVQQYIQRLQPQIASDSRFQEVRLLGYNGDDPTKPYIATTGTVGSQQDWVSLETFIQDSHPPIPVTMRTVLVRRPITNFTDCRYQIMPDGDIVWD